MMRLTITLVADENEHQSFIDALPMIIDDIKGGYEKNEMSGNVSGTWIIEPINNQIH